jgi:hypothetical protein
VTTPEFRQPNEEISQAEIDARQALGYWTSRDNAAYDSLSENAKRLIARIGSHLPDEITGVDSRARALIDAQARAWAIEERANDYADLEEAKRLGRKILAQRSGKGRSWAPVDMAAVWADAENATQTDVGQLSGDMPLGIFYRGKVNGVHAESEAGKSWLACWVAVQEIRAGRHVAYIDFEDDAASIVHRLKLLGASREDIATRFHYHSPTGPLTEADEQDFQHLVSIEGALVIFDGMTEAMALEGLEANKAEDVAAWHAKMTKPFASTGWGVVVLDHVPHEGKRALGSQHKKSALTGVSYFLEPVNPIGKGVVGKSRLKVEKDRPAWVRSHSVPGRTPQHFADLVIDFKEKRMPTANIWPARPVEDKGYKSEPSEKLRNAILGFVAENPGCSTTMLRDGVTGGNQEIDAAREWLANRAQLIIEEVGQARKHYPADPAGTLP